MGSKTLGQLGTEFKHADLQRGSGEFAIIIHDFVDLGDVTGFGFGGFAHGVEPRREARILAVNTPGARINLTRVRPPGSLAALTAWRFPNSGFGRDGHAGQGRRIKKDFSETRRREVRRGKR